MVASIHPINLSIHVKTAGIVNITPPKETMHTRTCMLAGGFNNIEVASRFE